jgi:hypothetical protein
MSWITVTCPQELPATSHEKPTRIASRIKTTTQDREKESALRLVEETSYLGMVSNTYILFSIYLRLFGIIHLGAPNIKKVGHGCDTGFIWRYSTL